MLAERKILNLLYELMNTSSYRTQGEPRAWGTIVFPDTWKAEFSHEKIAGRILLMPPELKINIS